MYKIWISKCFHLKINYLHILWLENCFENLVKCKNGYTFAPGEMAEWSIAAVLKTVELRGSGGSNPSLSAENESSNKKVLDYQLVKDFFFYST